MGNRKAFTSNTFANRNGGMNPTAPEQAIQVDDTTTEVVEEVVEDVTAPDEVVAEATVESEPVATEVPEPQVVVPEATPVAPASTRVLLLTNKAAEFVTAYPTNRILDDSGRTAMVRHVEMLVNIILSSTSPTEIATMLAIVREALHTNQGNVFSRNRIIGQMRDPRTGALRVQHERTINIMSLLYMTAEPTAYLARKGKIDVANTVKGCPSEAALAIIHYFS